MDKKRLFLWSLYDFANSIVYINFVLYFAQWIVVDAGLSDFWYNAIFAIATIILIFTAPPLAAHSDKYGGRKRFINISTIGTFVGYGLVAILAGMNGNIWLIALLFLVGQYFYQLAFVFYNPMLEDVADEAHRSRASGIGQFASSLGFVVGILITLPLADSRTTPLLVSVFAFFVLALPFLFYFKETKKFSTDTASVPKETKVFIKKMVGFFAVSTATPMLVAFFFFNDALVTISNNYSIYLERVFSVPDTTKSILLLAILAMSAVGGVFAGWIGDKIGPLKTLKIILIAWIILLPFMATAPNISLIYILSPLSGLLIGSVWTVTRSYLMTVLPKENMGYGFSFYTIAERFATFVGPLTWGGIIWIWGPESFAYRLAIGSMAVFMVIGLLVLHYWRRDSVKGAQTPDLP